MLLLLPFVLWQYKTNQNKIKHQKRFNLVMNAACQWHLIDCADRRVTEASLVEYWVTPVFLAISLDSVYGKFHYLILRNKTDEASFSRLNVGIQTNEKTID